MLFSDLDLHSGIIKAIKEALAYTEMNQLMAAMGHNVIVVLSTQLLLSIGYILATIF